MFDERKFLEKYIQAVEKSNKDAGNDLTGLEDEVLQRARWAFLLNAVTHFDDKNVNIPEGELMPRMLNLGVFINFVKNEKESAPKSAAEYVKELEEEIGKMVETLKKEKK